jgi:PEP-CTERM motif
MPSFLPSELTRRACSALAFVVLVPAAAVAQGLSSDASTVVSYQSRYDDVFVADKAIDSSSLVITSNGSLNGVQEAFAQADLAAGTLRARVGGTADEIDAYAHASFGDTFGALDLVTGLAHIWRPRDVVTFNFSVTGAVQSTLSANDMAALDKDFVSRGRLSFAAYKPGYFDLSARRQALLEGPWSEQSWSEAIRLGKEIQGLMITETFVRLGRDYSPDYDGSGLSYVEFNSDEPTVVSASFAPEGSFEWKAFLDISTQFSADIPLGYRPTFVMDFSHTIGASFVGPDGTVTTAASGLFPDTVSAVPEPHAYTLALAGLAAAALMSRKRRA